MSDAPPPAPPRPRRSQLPGAAAGFAVAAVVVLVLGLTGVLSFGADDSGTSSTASISLPATIGSYVRFADAQENKQPAAKSAVANFDSSDRRTEAALSAAYDGAGATVQTYTDQDLTTYLSVWAIRAKSPDPVVPVTDAAYLGLAEPPQRVVRVGADACELHSIVATPKGRKVPSNADAVVYCQRSKDKLTVRVMPSGDSPIAHDPSKVAAVLDEVWAALR